MNPQSRPRFCLYMERTFSKKFDSTFGFVAENWRPLLKYVTLILLPVAIVQGVCLQLLMSAVMKGSESSTGYVVQLAGSYLGTVVLYLVGGMLLASVVYALMRLYLRREERLAGLSGAEFKSDLMFCLRREAKVTGVFVAMSVAMAIAFVAVVAVAAAIDSLGLVWLLFLLCIGVLVVLMPLLLSFPAAVFADVTVWEAFRRAWRLGFGTWWGMLGFLAVLMMLVSTLSYMLCIPWSVCVLLEETLFTTDVSASVLAWQPAMSALCYVLGVGMVYVNYLFSSVVMIALAIQYGHASEKIEGTSVETAIETFEKDTPAEDEYDAVHHEIDEFENL